MTARRWIGWLTGSLMLTCVAGPSLAQSWNLYGGTTSYFIPFWNFNAGANRYEQVSMSPSQAGQVFLSLNGGPATLFTMDTGSSGIIANRGIMPTTGLTSLGPGSQFYDSSGVVLNGDYYLTNVRIMSSQSTVATTATVVALLATNQTCAFANKGCTPDPNPTPAYMGVGFDRGVSAITPPGPNTNVNPFINVNAGGVPYSQGYVVTNSGVYLGLTNALTTNYAFVKLMPNPAPGGQASAAWLQAPMTIAVGGATGSGQILPDSGISYAFLTAPPGANIPTSSCAGGNCANAGLPVQVFLPGQTTPQIAFYNFTTGGSGNPLQPDFVQVVPGSSVFLNTGREFYAGFNYFFDPVNGFVGYQWNGSVSSQYGFVVPIVALQGNVTLPASLSSSFPTYLMSNTTLSSAGTVVFQGSLFGPGGLAIASGDISLTGSANTYLGGTTINGGRLSLGPGATLPYASALTMNGGTFNLNGNTQVLSSLNGSGGTLALGGGLLALDTTVANTLGSSITGNGMFAVQGGGSLNLTGNSAGFRGSTIVSNANLAVNGSLGGNVFVAPNGTLSGNGLIAGNLFNSGFVTPGNSVGTLTVSGNYNQTAAGSYLTEVFGSGVSDRISVGGSASLGGQVVVTALPGLAFAPRTTYTILSAAGGLSGTFASVNELYPFLLSSLSYDANNAYLTLELGGFAAAAANPTQYAVGSVLDANVGTATGDFATVLSSLAVNTLSNAQAQAVLTQLSGNNYAAFGSTMVQGAQLFMNTFANQAGGGGSPVSNRVALAQACDVACDATAPPLWGAWGGALGGLGTIGANAGTGTVTYNVGGFAAGLDRLVAPNFRAGVTAGYTTGSQWVGGFNGKGMSDTFQAGLYGGYAQGPLYADAIAGYAYSYNQMWRAIALPGLAQRTARGGAGANQFYGQLETGYRFDLGTTANAWVTPFARLQAYTGTQNAVTETGAQSVNLNVAAQTTNSLRSVLGAQLGGSLDMGWREKLALQLRLGWSHEYASTARPVTASFAGAPAALFTTYGTAPQRDGVVAGFSANTAIAQATSIYMRYEANISGQDSAHALTAGLRMTW